MENNEWLKKAQARFLIENLGHQLAMIIAIERERFWSVKRIMTRLLQGVK